MAKLAPHLEYFLMLLIYVTLLIILCIIYLRKWKREGYLITVFEVYVSLIASFLIFRVFLFSYLLFFGLVIVPFSEAYEDSWALDLLTDFSVLFYDILHLTGFNFLFNSIAVGYYIWKYIALSHKQKKKLELQYSSKKNFFFVIEKESRTWIIVLNLVLWGNPIVFLLLSCISLLIQQGNENVGLIMQFSYLILLIVGFILIFVTFFHLRKMYSKILHYKHLQHSSSNIALLIVSSKRCYYYGMIGLVAFLIRIIAVTMDTVVEYSIPIHSVLHTIWNITFKFILCLFPELFCIIFFGIAMSDTEDVYTCLANEQSKYLSSKIQVERQEIKVNEYLPEMNETELEELKHFELENEEIE